MQLCTVYLYLETALHVPGVTSTHHQERKQLYLQHLVFVTPLLLPAAIAAGSSNDVTYRELRSSLREYYSFISLPADTTMASSQGTSVSSNSFSRWTSHDIFLFQYHFLLHILCFLFFFSDNIMADVANKQQTTALFLSNIVTRTRRHTELTNLMGKMCCAREHSVQFFLQFFTQWNCTV